MNTRNPGDVKGLTCYNKRCGKEVWGPKEMFFCDTGTGWNSCENCNHVYCPTCLGDENVICTLCKHNPQGPQYVKMKEEKF